MYKITAVKIKTGSDSYSEEMPIEVLASNVQWDNSQSLVDYLNTVINNIADEYDNTSTYLVNDYCIYEGQLYQCTTAVTTAETFDPNKWALTSITAAFDDKMDKVNPTGSGSFSLNRKANSTIGLYSTAEGYNNEAAGRSSHVQGENNTATAGAVYAHVEGWQNTSSSYYTHVEGTGNTVSAYANHAEGESNTAAGYCSHVEGHGTQTLASASYSHAEGNNTTVSATCAHAEGNSTTASGSYSHAEGYSTTASGGYSHTEGYQTVASANYTHAEGYSTEALDVGAHAEGYDTKAFGQGSHAEGSQTQATGTVAHAEGYKTAAAEDYTHAEGYQTVATQIAAHSEGQNTQAVNICAHAEGQQTTASGTCSHAEGQGTKAIGSNSHAEGSYTLAVGTNQHVFGKYNIPDGNDTYVEIVGGGTGQTAANIRTLDWQGNMIIAGDLTNGRGTSINGLSTAILQVLSDFTQSYNELGTYNIDDVVIYDNQLYKCTTAIPVAEGPFVPAHWTRTTVFQFVGNGKSLIAGAITDKGVQTSANDTFTTMANNISLIPSGGSTGALIVPDYCGLSYAALNYGGAFAAGSSNNGCMNYFKVKANTKYVIYLEDTTATRYMIQFYSDLYYDTDFSQWTSTSGSGNKYTSTQNITGSMDGNKNYRFIYTPATDGTLIVRTSNNTTVIPAYCFDTSIVAGAPDGNSISY